MFVTMTLAGRPVYPTFHVELTQQQFVQALATGKEITIPVKWDRCFSFDGLELVHDDLTRPDAPEVRVPHVDAIFGPTVLTIRTLRW